MEGKNQQSLDSPVSVVGFACTSPSCAASDSNTQRSSGLRSPARSMLSMLLSHEPQGLKHEQEDDFIGEDDSECGDYEQCRHSLPETCRGPTAACPSFGSQHQTTMRTAPVAIPDKLWHKVDRDGQWAMELRRIQYERCVRRQQQEQARVHAQLQAQGYYAQQQQVQAVQGGY